MNLFRSEEHVKAWTFYDAISAESIMPLAKWVTIFSGPLFSRRLEPDYLARLQEYAAKLFASLTELGKTGPFWNPG